jgi:nucleotide-binding universal stress UspA family protein
MLFRADDANMRRRSALHRVRRLADRFQGRTTLKWEQRVVARKFIPAMRECAAKADLLLLDAPVRPGLRDIAMGTSAERLLRRIQQPVLVVRRRARRGYRHVLVAVDLSTDPQKAIAYAQTLAPFAKVSLLHAYRAQYEGKMRYVGVSEAAIRWHRTEASTSAATRMVDIAVSCLPTNDARLLLAHGYPVTRLLEKAQEVRADLIVVTKRERSLARALLEDSVSLQLVTRSPCDVLVVPQDAGFGNGAFGSAGICNIAQSHRLDAGQMIDENTTTMDGRLDAAFRGTVSRRNGR